MLEALLNQKAWRRGRRGRWYDRRAQLCIAAGKKDEKLLKESLQGIAEALTDPNTGIGKFHF